MWKHVEYFCKKNPNTLFSDWREIHSRCNRKTFSIEYYLEDMDFVHNIFTSNVKNNLII